jgi:exosortase A-associated hydrolase 1
LRFDYRGMGDSDGPPVAFTEIGDDIRAAVDELIRRMPSIERIVLWGLCDGATASATYASGDPRIAGLALFNPWVRSAAGVARVMLSTYYAKRLLQRSFWAKLLRGRISAAKSTRDLVKSAVAAQSPGETNGDNLARRFGEAIARSSGPILVGLSGNDFVAGEFKLAMTRDAVLAKGLAEPRVTVVEFAAVDHTFSCEAWRTACADATLAWLRTSFEQWLTPFAPAGQIAKEVD